MNFNPFNNNTNYRNKKIKPVNLLSDFNDEEFEIFHKMNGSFNSTNFVKTKSNWTNYLLDDEKEDYENKLMKKQDKNIKR